jgi:hypothetical protein
MELKTVPLEIPDGVNLILGQTHFIKTVEDVYEAIVTSVPQMKFGIAFNEASGPCLTRADGNDEELKQLAIRNASSLAAGHIFVAVMREGYPINVLNRIKDVPEVCATSTAPPPIRWKCHCGNRAGPRRHGRHRRLPAQGRRDRRGCRKAARFSAHDRLQALASGHLARDEKQEANAKWRVRRACR